MNLGPRGGKSVGNRGEHENSVSASQPGAWHPQPDLGGVASPPGGGAWPWGGARPGLGRRTHTSLRSSRLHQPGGGDPGECLHVRAATRAGPLPSGALRLRPRAPPISAARAEPGLAPATPSCPWTAFSLSLPFALHLPCIAPRAAAWVCSVQAGLAAPSSSGGLPRSAVPRPRPSPAASPRPCLRSPLGLAGGSRGAQDGRAGSAGPAATPL